MAAITIDDTARFVCIHSFYLGPGDLTAMARAVQQAVEQRASSEKGFIGCVVMMNRQEAHLTIVSIWESAHAWSAAQYDQVIGRVVADAVETAKSYELETYETVTVVQARS